MRLPRWLFILVSVVGILYWSQSLWKGNTEPSVFDLPKTLEKETYTITVYPVSNVNGVPVFTTSKGRLEEDYLYLTPASDSIDFPADYTAKKDSGYVLKVFGKFYQGKGIPGEYLYTTPKPERLRVFQFEKVELVAEQNNL
jgi:hypothetical protein